MILKLDIDGGRVPALGKITSLVRRTRPRRKVRTVSIERSPSGRGWHVVVYLPGKASAMEQVALQALLGSDPYREAYNVNRARVVDAGAVSPYWRKRWNVLYATRKGGER